MKSTILLSVVFVPAWCVLAPAADASHVNARSDHAAIFSFPLAHGSEDHGGGAADHEPAPSGGRHFVEWIGHFHPAMTVFPIAMLLAAALAELLFILGRGAWLDGAARWCVIVGAV